MSFFMPTYGAMTGTMLIASVDADLLFKVQSDDPTVVSYLSAIKERMPDVWTQMVSDYKEKAIGIDLEAYLNDNDVVSTEDDEDTCLLDLIDETLTMYEQALEKGDAPLEEPHKSLPISLLEAGYDVWINGFRGTKYQREHETMADFTDDRTGLWTFSNIEIATEDLVSEIDYILATTEQESLSYVGYSMGTMLMYYDLAMAGEDAELAKTINKVNRFLAITPCAWSNFMNSEQ